MVMYIVGRRLPVMTAERGRTGFDTVADLRGQDVRSVGKGTGFAVDATIDVLIDGRLNIDIGAGLAVELPQQPIFANREQHLPAVKIDQYPLEYYVHVERIPRHMLEMPLHRAGARIERQR